MKRLALILSVLPPLAYAQPAFAQEGEEAPPRHVLQQKATEVDFDAVDVNAALLGPTIGIGFERRRETFNPLIRLRADFNAELDATVGEVK